MSGQTERVAVQILGREYQLACEPHERAALIEAADYVDGKMTSIRDTAKIAGTDRIAVLAALQIAGELLASKSGSGEFAFGDLRRRIQSMIQLAESALASQDQ